MQRNSRSRPGARAVDPAALAAISGRITSLKQQERNPARVSLYVDDHFVLGIDHEVVVTLGLRVGEQIEGRMLLSALAGDERKRARDDALRYLAARPRAAAEVRRKLLGRYQPEAVAITISFLEQHGFLDDLAFAKAWVEAHPGWGMHRLRADLLRRGVGRELVDQVLGDTPDRTDEAFRAAEVRYRRMGALDPQTARRRLYAFLVRRGFDYATVDQAVRHVVQTGGED